MLALHNFADAQVEAAPLLTELAGVELTDVLDPAAGSARVDEDGRVDGALDAYGCRWLRTGG